MAAHLDPKLAEKILHEVKSQGVFDEFRKDSIADVDTKPAYQNLRQRVENTVHSFLSEQKWTPDTNKYQLRERLRRHIVESGFLDVGVERIVDQVVNPKIGSFFQPRIEEIAYKFLGISPPLPTKREPGPPPPPMPPMPPLPPCPPMNGSPLKIETDAPNNLLPTDLEQVSPDSDKVKEEDLNDSGTLEEKADDDDESPPFEPLTECKSPKAEEDTKTKFDANLDIKKEKIEKVENIKLEKGEQVESIKVEKVENIKVETIKNEEAFVPKEKNSSNDALASQESQLSQVSSDSRISSVSNQLLLQNGNDNSTDVNISEEAQMPKFNENSTGTEGSAKNSSELHFDIKKDEIKFEGTERKANILDTDRADFGTDAPVIKDTFVSDSLEMKGSFHFTKLNVEVEPCNTTRGPASSISSQDDTSSAQLCIVERTENELNVETNSLQKCPQEDSNTNTTINNSQIKQNDSKSDRNGKNYSSSSSSSSRLKKSSSKDKNHHSSDKNRQHDAKEREKSKYRDRDHERNRERYRDRDRNSDAKNSSKTSSSSSRRHESSEKHRSSSKRSEKERHMSSSSRSESHSRHKSSKRDHRDKDDRKKSHKYSSSSKEHRSGERKATRSDDHNESREKLRWRKSTDSNDEDKNPNNSRQTKNLHVSEPAPNVNTKRNGNGSNNCYKENNEKDSQENKNSDNIKSQSSHVVILNDVLQHPSTNFVELETKSSVQVHTNNQRSPTPTPTEETHTMDLLYFDQGNSQLLRERLELLNHAIDRCNHINVAMTTQEYTQVNNTSENNDNSDNEHSTFNDSACHPVDDDRIENMVTHTETKATLLVDCFHYSDCSDKNAHENMDSKSPKRLKLSTDCNITKLQTSMTSVVNVSTKENQLKENHSIMTDEDNKKSTHSKRTETLAKLSQQQRYSSEDLYKPRPVLGQRSKRRGLDTAT